MSPNTAPIKWAQRSDSLYVTIALPDVKDETINLSDEKLVFKGKSQDKDYQVDIEFFKSVDAKGSTYKVLPRSVQMVIMKAAKEEGEDEEFWPRLLKDKALEKNQVKIDWDRYVDEDEEDEAGGFDMSALEGGMGMGGMPGMGGMGGMGGMPGMEGMGGGMPGMGGMAALEGGMGMGGMPGMGGMGGMGGMPGMEGMGGGMPGMGGMGGGMPGMGGMGGPGGMDMEALMKQMGDMGGPGGGDGDLKEPDSDDDGDSDDDSLPDLEES
eukprot:CAMPEP_0197464924 /NCGR_PEP_ID=MMETSP1175-20131217/64275_1 /TAXON_ID=1003142 /ORGANISM="Triceratium dubium, Strain CCMP147" /LENGTH=266 /DNA_ID=CAMNT_0043000927 /DNA_START=190 /DNA_END=989 /DNA_ORIENTATION=+